MTNFKRIILISLSFLIMCFSFSFVFHVNPVSADSGSDVVLVDTLVEQSWNGLTNFNGNFVWNYSVNGNTYYSYGNEQYILDPSTSTWTPYNWGSYKPNGYGIWSHGNSYFYSLNNNHYKLDYLSTTWAPFNWNFKDFSVDDIWSDGTNTYISRGTIHYKLITLGLLRWEPVSFTGVSSFNADSVWSDGTNTYLTVSNNNSYIYYLLDSENLSWTRYNIYGLNNSVASRDTIWSNGSSTFLSYYFSVDLGNGNISEINSQFSFLNSNSTFISKSWVGFDKINAIYVWTDGTDYFYSYGSSQYKFVFAVGDSTYDYGFQMGINYVLSNLDQYGLTDVKDVKKNYDDGFNAGKIVGRNIGYNEGLEHNNPYTFLNLFGALFDAPISVLTSLLNFEIFGINMFALFTSLLTVAVILFIVKLIMKGGK